MSSFINARKTLSALMFAFVLSLAFVVAAPAHAATNLITNPGFEASSTAAESWNQGNWGTNDAAFVYPVAGHESANAAQVNITTYTDGDAKWYFAPVSVTAGAFYTFSDYYKSNATTSVVIAYYTNANDTEPASNVTVATVPPAADWAPFSIGFSPNSGYAKVTVFHLLSGVGSLSVDDYSLVETAAPADNLFDHGIVSLTFDDGWTSQYDNAFPAMLAANFKATFYLIGTALKNASVPDLFLDSKA